jgi:hypothetical protein
MLFRLGTQVAHWYHSQGQPLLEHEHVCYGLFGIDNSFVLVEPKLWEHAVELACFEATQPDLIPESATDGFLQTCSCPLA